MGEFDLDLRAVEEMIDDEEDGNERSLVLARLDGTTDPEEWIELVSEGHALVLSIDGDLNELAAGFAREIRDDGGELVHFRGFLIVAPDELRIDTERLG